LPGYNGTAELLDNNRRRRYELPPAERAAKIDDESQWDVGLVTRMRVSYEAIVSTSSNQIAVTPGYLEREWEEDGRRYFHYKMDEPIWPFVSFLSADYEMKSDKWNDVDLEVYYKHEQNVDRMLEASKKSLDYFTTNFSPYQYRQYRIFEFPRQRGAFAQSFPNTIPFSEAIGFVADIRDPEAIDYVFYVTAHEFAHQWWGHQVVGANVQGAAVLTETLAQYSALMVMEKEYGAAHMQRFLKYELDNYLNSRGAEVLEELPLMLVENQGYIHYRKGSLVLYALKDYLGEDTVNLILREFIADWGFKAPPYPTTRHLLAKIRENAPQEYQDIITDLFEKIVLYDLRAEDSHYTELPDGRFEVTINTAAIKFEADGKGEETEVAMNALIDIAVLGEEDEETKVPEILHIEKRRVDSENQTFVFIVDSRPVSVGIDPLNKLIDRNPDDNTKNVDVLH
jgi:ABC-2 type transport system permease protein